MKIKLIKSLRKLSDLQKQKKNRIMKEVAKVLVVKKMMVKKLNRIKDWLSIKDKIITIFQSYL